MSEQAAPASAPSAPGQQVTIQPAGPPPNWSPEGRVHAGDNFQEFMDQVAEREKRVDQPPPKPKTVQPQPKPPAEGLPTDQPPAELEAQPTEQAPTDEQPQDQQQQQQQISPEDLELLKKAKEWLAGDYVPDEFAKKLVKLKNGEEWDAEPFEEALGGRLRQREFIRSQQQFDREREEWQKERTAYQGHFEAIFSDENGGAAGGDAMFEIFTRAGKHNQLMALYNKIRDQDQSDIDAANGLGLAIMHRERIKDPNDHRVQSAIKAEYDRRKEMHKESARARALEYENQRLKQLAEQKQRNDQNAEYFATQKRALDQLRPRAFEQLGLNHEDPVHRTEFDTYLDAFIRHEKASKVTPELVMKSARCVLDKLQMEAKKKKDPQPNAGAKPFTPQLGAGGGSPNGKRPDQWHAENFAQHHNLPRWGG